MRDYRERLDFAATMVAHGADAQEIATECDLATEDAERIVAKHKDFQERKVINITTERIRRRLANGTL